MIDEMTEEKQADEQIPKMNVDNNKEETNDREEKEDTQKNLPPKRRLFFAKQKTGANTMKQNMDKANEKYDNGGQDEQCAHEIIIKDMCGNCGKDLRIKGGFSGDRIERAAANVSMIHHVPELVVSNEIANKLGARDHENILQQRKLILLVDLDQTLVHTSNRPPKPNEVGSQDMFGYQLFGSAFFTKVRPHTRHFLERINKLYEMHIVTYGQRMYAHKIGELLDPNKAYFDYRILSRDELLSSMHKSGNLRALFPCSEQLIVMLDDRPDVWMHSEALIRVKPYRFFTEVGDINAPPQEWESDVKSVPAAAGPGQTMEEKEKATVFEEKQPAQSVLPHKDEEGQIEGGKEAEEEKGATTMKGASGSDFVDVDKTKGKEVGPSPASAPIDELSQPIPPIPDDDNALEHVERILVEIHALFYQQYDRDKKVPDVKRIVGWLRSQVLAGERIVFSGIVPLGVDVRACEIYRLCTQFGAKVDEKVLEGQTTVLVAAKAATEKMRQARRCRIPIVGTRWLDMCFERWQKVDKRDFLFIEEEEEGPEGPAGQQKREQPAAGRNMGRKRRSNGGGNDEEEDEEEAEGRQQFGGGLESGRRHSEAAGPLKRARLTSESLGMDQKMDHFAQMDTLDKQALHDMEDEVASALSEEGEEGEEEGEEGGDGSSKNEEEYEEGGEGGREASAHGKAWEDQFVAGGERYEEGAEREESGFENTDEGEFSGRYLEGAGEYGEEEEDDEENTNFDYGDDMEGDEEEDETTRDIELDADEDELYDEMAADIEQQLNGGDREERGEGHSKRRGDGDDQEGRG